MTAGVRRGAQAALLCLVLLTELLPAFSDAPLSVAVVLSRDVAPYRQGLKGFEEVLRGAGRGYKLHECVAEGVANDPSALIEKIRARRPDLILTIGSAATTLVAGHVQDIPVIFSMVLPSSGSAALQGLRQAHDNVTGASMEIPLKTQFAKVREVLPEIRTVGVLFNPGVSGPIVETASRIAAEMGLEVVALPVESEKDLLRGTADLAARVDVLWSVADGTVFTPQGLKHILLATLRDRVPFVGLSPSFVKAGALLALSVDYMDVGRQSGELALRVLSGERPSRVPMTAPRNVSLSVNLNTAKQIQVHIQDEVRRKAELYF